MVHRHALVLGGQIQALHHLARVRLHWLRTARAGELAGKAGTGAFRGGGGRADGWTETGLCNLSRIRTPTLPSWHLDLGQDLVGGDPSSPIRTAGM